MKCHPLWRSHALEDDVAAKAQLYDLEQQSVKNNIQLIPWQCQLGTMNSPRYLQGMVNKDNEVSRIITRAMLSRFHLTGRRRNPQKVMKKIRILVVKIVALSSIIEHPLTL